MKDEPVTKPWYAFPDLPSQDQYQFFLDAGPLTNLDAYYKEDNVFWQQIKDHPNYDEFWRSRGIIQHLNDIKPAVMVVGGLFDAEDLYGPFNTYRKIEETSDNYNILVYGPWSHGDWARSSERQAIGNVYFGDNLSRDFQQNYETVFFNHFLKNDGEGTIDFAKILANKDKSGMQYYFVEQDQTFNHEPLEAIQISHKGLEEIGFN